jgi:hypothetical protein
VKPRQEPEIPSFQEYPLDFVSFVPNSDLLVSPDTTFARTFVDNLTSAMPETFNNSFFFTNKRKVIGVDFSEASQKQIDYSLRFSSGSVPQTNTLFASQGTG